MKGFAKIFIILGSMLVVVEGYQFLENLIPNYLLFQSEIFFGLGIISAISGLIMWGSVNISEKEWKLFGQKQIIH